jgi:outer membrane lipoprotein-sorting protein
MKRTACSFMAIAGFLSICAAAENGTASTLTADQIVEKNADARGGLEAWRKIETMAWAGHIESANAPAPNLPFVLEIKRPNKTRFEITALNQKAIRVYDGSNGWKVRPAQSGKPEVQPYTSDELKFAQEGEGIDGLLLDSRAKGYTVTLDGIDEIEARSAYRLGVRLPSGATRHVWVDAANFLDLKSDRTWRNANGQTGTVVMSYRDYQAFAGVQLPTTIETGSGSPQAPDKMVIERIALNPSLDERAFAKPTPPGRRNAVAIRAEAAPQATSESLAKAASPSSSRLTGASLPSAPQGEGATPVR